MSHTRLDAAGAPAVPYPVDLPAVFADRLRDPDRQLPSGVLVGGLHHHPDQLLGSRRAQQDSAGLDRVRPRPRRTADRTDGASATVALSATSTLISTCGRVLHRRRRAQRAATGLRHPRHQPQPGDDAVAGGAERGHHDVAGLFAAERVLAGAQSPRGRSGRRRWWCARRCPPHASPGAARDCSSPSRPGCSRPAHRPPAWPAPAPP